MKHLTLALAASCTAAPAVAAEIVAKPIADARLRYEDVSQDGFARDAHALTLRGHAGLELSSGRWSFLAESGGTLALSEDYDSGLNGKTAYPIVADPQNVELNRLQVQYHSPGFVATAGRQRINLEDQRFVGASGWRQNDQTFDAVRVEADAAGFKIDLAYAWSVRTIWGFDGKGARQQAIAGDNLFGSVKRNTPIGAVTAFAYRVDQDEAAISSFRLSSQTYGLRLAGSRPISKAKLAYVLSYARQSDMHRNPNDYSADYWLAEIGAEIGGWKLAAGQERLGADDGRPLTSFQTPLATLHKFQGWADKFLTTPPNGLRDSYASLGYGWKKVAGLDGAGATLVYHRFDSDRLDLRYGSEWDASVFVKKGRWTATAKIADYAARTFATDTRKLWLQLEWAY